MFRWSCDLQQMCVVASDALMNDNRTQIWRSSYALSVHWLSLTDHYHPSAADAAAAADANNYALGAGLPLPAASSLTLLTCLLTGFNAALGLIVVRLMDIENILNIVVSRIILRDGQMDRRSKARVTLSKTVPLAVVTG